MYLFLYHVNVIEILETHSSSLERTTAKTGLPMTKLLCV